MIQDSNGRFCKLEEGKKRVFVSNPEEAYLFSSDREASDYIRKNYSSKRARRNFKIIRKEDYVSEFQTIEVDVKSPVSFEPIAPLSISDMKAEINHDLIEHLEIRREELRTYEGMLQDVLHFLREPDTHLNMYQGYLVVQKLQELLRARCESKKEFQRIGILMSETNRAIEQAESFEYNKYKSKVIPDMKAYLFSKEKKDETDD